MNRLFIHSGIYKTTITGYRSNCVIPTVAMVTLAMVLVNMIKVAMALVDMVTVVMTLVDMVTVVMAVVPSQIVVATATAGQVFGKSMKVVELK